MKRLLCILTLLVSIRCDAYVSPKSQTLKDRIPPPAVYTLSPLNSSSFASYLSNIILKPEGSLVHYYDGRVKQNDNIYVAVVDLDIGHKDLQQCADAIMRLRAEYLYHSNRQNDIGFTFTNGFWADYTHCKEGYRVTLHGTKTQWIKNATPSATYSSFRQYLDMIFSYCGTRSLSKELKPIPYKN